MKIAVIGIGFVGKAITKLLARQYDVLAKDLLWEVRCSIRGSIERRAVPSTDYGEVNTCDAAVICVPTGMNPNGSCDTSIVEDVVKNCQCKYIMIKSTVPPGTTKRLADKYQYSKRIIFSPEYLGESKYFTPYWKYPHPNDLRYHNFQIFGGERKATNFFVEMFQRILGPTCRYIQTDSTTAELAKYMENCWGAAKVTFVNEFYKIAEAFDVDFRELRELWLLDSRIERMHTSVFEGNFGFGGKCFPKDLNALIHASLKGGYVPGLLMQVVRCNDNFRISNDEEKVNA